LFKGEESWQWLASIRYGERSICSGTLISPQHLLTAAMCVNADIDPLTVVLKHNSKSSKQIVKVNNVDLHPDFNIFNFSSNLAVLTLSEELQLEKDIMPICLSEKKRIKGKFIEAGFATFENGDDTITSKDVEIIEKSHCQEVLGKTDIEFVNFSLTKDLLCTKDHARVNSQECVGDLGGPLIRKSSTSGQYEVVGVRTIPLLCGPDGPNIPGMYTSLAGYRRWMKKIIDNRH